jgi:uncharacterized protein (TIRG00374 family)
MIPISMNLQPENKKQKNKNRWMNIAFRLVGLALFAWIITRVNLRATFTVLRHADLILVVGGILMAVPIVYTRSWRYKLILHSFGVELTMPQTLLIRLVGAAAGDMLPGRTGEVVSVAYLQQAGYGLRDPSLTLILDRLFDFVILALWAIAGFGLIGQKLNGRINGLESILILTAVGFSLVIVLLLLVRSRPGMMGRLVLRLVPSRYQGTLNAMLTGNAKPQFFHWDALVVAEVAGASIFSFVFLILRGLLLARAIGIGLSLPFLAACMAITTLLQLIPVSNVMGVGTREVSLVYLFGLAGIPSEVALGFSFLIVLALLAQDLIGLYLWWRYPVGTPYLERHQVLELNHEVLEVKREA